MDLKLHILAVIQGSKHLFITFTVLKNGIDFFLHRGWSNILLLKEFEHQEEDCNLKHYCFLFEFCSTCTVTKNPI